MEYNKVMVSVLMPTYNHEKYVRQAIDSALSQEIDFNIEIIVADDASTDKTQQILYDEYKEKVKLVLRKKNLGGTKNMYDLLRKAKGKYVILLEGDDYWINEKVLKHMVEFLETNKTYVGVAGKLKVVNEQGRFLGIILGNENRDSKISLENYLAGQPLQFRSVLWKNVYKDMGKELCSLYKANNMLGDFTLNLFGLENGEVFIGDEIISAYRFVVKKGKSNYNSVKTSYDIYEDHIKVITYLEKKHNTHHNYNKLYYIRTDVLIKTLIQNRNYFCIKKILNLIGIKKFLISILLYNQYKNFNV